MRGSTAAAHQRDRLPRIDVGRVDHRPLRAVKLLLLLLLLRRRRRLPLRHPDRERRVGSGATGWVGIVWSM
eukprot:COSAG02_NODE_3357_length_6878_cov_3.553326_3_plen_71_part_00